MVVNTAEVLPGDFTRNADCRSRSSGSSAPSVTAAGADNTLFHRRDGWQRHCSARSIGANMFMLGYAYQIGGLPLSAEAIERALELNGEAVAMNIAAFRWGRRAAVDAAAGREAAVAPAAETLDPARILSQSFDEVVARRVAYLSDYQNAAYAARYKAVVAQCRASPKRRSAWQDRARRRGGRRNLFGLMAYKDEYEVARLYSDGTFRKQVANELGGENVRLNVHLAPPLLARRDKRTGIPEEDDIRSVDILCLPACCAKLKFVRGTAFDLFGYTAERQTERRSFPTTKRC